jgi:hypothetical protein
VDGAAGGPVVTPTPQARFTPGRSPLGRTELRPVLLFAVRQQYAGVRRYSRCLRNVLTKTEELFTREKDARHKA